MSSDSLPHALTLYPGLVGSAWTHKKTGGVYEVRAIGRIEADLTICVIYTPFGQISEVWVRPVEEFLDGRFLKLEKPKRRQALGA